MKKLLFLAVGLFALQVQADTPSITMLRQSFINNGTYVCLSNNTTYLNYTNGSATNIWYFSYTAYTNIFAGTAYTNLTSGTTNNNLPAAFTDVEIPADLNKDVNPNLVLKAIVGVYSNFPYVSGSLRNRQSPEFIAAQATGYSWINTNLPTAFFPYEAAGTNSITFTFAPVDVNGYADTSEGKQFSWAIAQTSLALPRIISTNLNTTFMQGVTKLRLVSVVVGATGSAKGVVLTDLSIEGY